MLENPSIYYAAVLRIRITFMRIRISLYTFMGIQILLLNKVMPICGQWSTDLPRLIFAPPWLYFELNYSSWISTLIRLRLPKIKRIRADTDPDPVRCNMPSKLCLAQPALVSLRIPFLVRGISWTTPPNMPAHNTMLLIFLIQTTLTQSFS